MKPLRWRYGFLPIFALCSCSFLKQQHAEEHATASLSEEAQAIEEAQAKSSETYTEEPTVVTVDTTTEVFQPVIQNPLLLEVPCRCPDGGACVCLQNPPPPAIAKRTTTHRTEQHGTITDEKSTETTGKASASLSLDAGVQTEGITDKKSDTKPAPGCALGGTTVLIILGALALGLLFLYFGGSFRRKDG